MFVYIIFTHICVLHLTMQNNEMEKQKYMFIFCKTHHKSYILSVRFTSVKILDM